MKTPLGHSQWESSYKLGVRQSLARWLNLSAELCGMLLLRDTVFRVDEIQLKKTRSRCRVGKQCSARGILRLWRDSECTKECQRQILFLLYGSDQGGPAQKEYHVVTKERNGILLTISL